MRFALPKVIGRHEGLGNELFAWAKAFIGGQVLGLTVLQPPWGLNRRGYRRYFRTSWFDWLGYEYLRQRLPDYKFTEEDFLKYQPASFAEAVRQFGIDNKLAEKKHCIVEFSGLWGGIPAIIEARDFILASLLNTRYTAENLYAFRRQLPARKIIVGLHIRRGDFAKLPDAADYQATFNTAIPLEWYRLVCASLRQSHSGHLAFVLFSDGTAEDLAPLLEDLKDDVFFSKAKNSDISDLLALASCDVIVCSNSSYSIWACGLSSSRYIWFAPQLSPIEGRKAIWGRDPSEIGAFGYTRRNLDSLAQMGDLSGLAPRGVAVGWDGVMPAEFHDYLESVRRSRYAELDLILSGSV